MKTRPLRALALLAVLCPLAVALSLFLGGGWSRPWELFEPGRAAILELRLWRIVQGSLVGAALATSGAVLQAVLRNPLAEPYVLGLSAGAGLLVALLLSLAAASAAAAAGWAPPAAAFAGAMLSLFAVVHIAEGAAGRRSPHTLILAGVGWSALCGSLLMFAVTRLSGDGLRSLAWWFLGDLQAYDPRLAAVAATLVLVLLVVLFFRARDLNVLALGDEATLHLGLHPERTRLLFLALAAALAGIAVSVAGLIGFVGLVIPHLCRAAVGGDHRRLLPACALAGAAALCVFDGLGRTVLHPEEIPAGVLTALAGAPFFLALLRGGRRNPWKA
jgi:iron complex transport system permease protein